MPQIKTKAIWLVIRDNYDHELYDEYIILDNEKNVKLLDEMEQEISDYYHDNTEYNSVCEVIDKYYALFDRPNLEYRTYEVEI